MRDTVLLRRRLNTLMTCIPFAGAPLQSGCTEGATSSSAAAKLGGDERPSPEPHQPDEATARGKSSRDPGAPGPDLTVQPPTLPTSRFDPIAGDPPLVDGYNPEEATCPAGNWCGVPSMVAPLALQTAGTVMDCPDRLSGSMGQANGIRNNRHYDGLSLAPAMLAAFNEGKTVRERSRGKDDVCCYHWFEYCSGRPLTRGPHGLLAPLRDGRAWITDDDDGSPVDASPSLRAAVARRWMEDGLMEHASIAAFARTTLELLAVAAPPELIAGCQRAALDEIDHTRRCFTAAHRYGAVDREAGPLPAVAPRALDLVGVALSTFEEGCIGETVAALAAGRAAAWCRDPELTATLEVIADDETRHAGLAWAILRWALREGGQAVAAALRARHAELAAVVSQPLARNESDDPDLSIFGQPSARTRHEIRREAWIEIVSPMVADLLGDRSSDPATVS